MGIDKSDVRFVILSVLVYLTPIFGTGISSTMIYPRVLKVKTFHEPFDYLANFHFYAGYYQETGE